MLTGGFLALIELHNVIKNYTSGRKDLKPVVEHNGQVFVMGLYSVNQEALIS